MFRIYSEQQDGYMYLSPYTNIIIDSDKLLITQTLFNCTTKLVCKCHWSQKILISLNKGVDEKTLLEYFEEIMSKNEAKEMLYNWIRMGVIE